MIHSLAGTWNDLLQGGIGADTYRFALGDGHDVIEFEGESDSILFESGISLSDISAEVGGDGSDLILRVNGANQSITLRGVMFNNSFGANEIRFAGEPAATIGDLILSKLSPTNGDDHIRGSYHGGPWRVATAMT